MRGYLVGALLGAIAGVPNSVTTDVTRTPAREVVVVGRVTDASTTRGLEGAQVLADQGGTASTGPKGDYKLVVPVAGQTVTLRVRHVGYEQAERRVRLAGDTVHADFALVAAAARLQPQAAVAKEATSARKEEGRTKRADENRAAMPADAVATASPLHGVVTSPATPSYAPPLAGAATSRRSRGERGGWVAVDTTGGFNTEGYALIAENPFLDARATPRSTFAIDVDRASYSNVRRFLNEGRLPPKDAVRIEELVNYFSYDYRAPRGDEPFAVNAEVAPAPWNRAHSLVRIGLQGRRVDAERLPPSNFVFLVDVSGSMQSADKLPLVKASLRLLVDELRDEDRVAIVVYAGAAGLALPSTPGSRKARIREAIDALEAGGSTAGGAGIQLAYAVAREHHVRGGNNRVILATDGDFNVGVSSDAELVRLIEQKREQGTFLTVLGYGTGNLKDSKMEQLADKGNGNYAYVDGLHEARKVLVREMGGTLHTIAKDVKVQVEFNPRRVQSYRLIGYENRALRDEDFADDRKDGGELGAGHTVTALYEVVPVGAPRVGRRADPLRYQRRVERPEAADGEELLYVKLRYKAPDGRTSRLLEQPVLDRAGAPSRELTFAAAVAAFGMLLRDSEHKGDATMSEVIAMASRSLGEDPHGDRADFVRLATEARRLLQEDEPVAVREDQ
jgi:Ca-activated chloride channel homolog